MFKTRTAVFYQVLKMPKTVEGPFRLDKTRAVSVLNNFKNDPLLVVEKSCI